MDTDVVVMLHQIEQDLLSISSLMGHLVKRRAQLRDAATRLRTGERIEVVAARLESQGVVLGAVDA